jgi:uncharacterized protein (DUF433 family)/DNA-binding transcriptional MerR regulator
MAATTGPSGHRNRPTAIGHYSAKEVARLAGVSPRRIGSWARYGIIPSISTRPRVYSYADAGEAVLVRYLVEQMFPTSKIRRIVLNLRDQYGQWPLATAPLKHDGRLAVIEEGDDLYIDAADRGDQGDQGVIAKTFLDLTAVRIVLENGGWAAYRHPREHIQVDPDRLSGQPVVRDSRVPTAVVADLARRPEGRALLKEDYELTDDEIRDAVEYEADVETLVA